MHKAELDKFKDKLLGEYNVTYIDILWLFGMCLLTLLVKFEVAN
jgi:hypothetical protein